MKTDLFQSCGHCWVFQICWHIECSTFTASSFKIWNSSTGIPSPPLALFVVMLPKAHLASHSRMSNSLRPYRRQPTRLPRPWDSPDKNTGVGCYFLLQGMKVKSESEVAQSYPTLWPHGLQPTRLLHPWDFPGNSTGVGRCGLLLLATKSSSFDFLNAFVSPATV